MIRFTPFRRLCFSCRLFRKRTFTRHRIQKVLIKHVPDRKTQIKIWEDLDKQRSNQDLVHTKNMIKIFIDGEETKEEETEEATAE
jgi:thioredoxin-related protein